MNMQFTKRTNLPSVADGNTNSHGNIAGSRFGLQDGNPTNLNALVTSNYSQMFNGSTWDRQYNNMQGTLLASAARTATTVSPNQTNYNAAGVQIFVNVSVASGTGGLVVYICGVSADGTNSTIWLNVAPTAITGIGKYTYEIYPYGNPSTSNDVKQRTTGILPRVWYVGVVHNDSSSYTYGISYSLVV